MSLPYKKQKEQSALANNNQAKKIVDEVAGQLTMVK